MNLRRFVFLLVIISIFLTGCELSNGFGSNKTTDEVSTKWADITKNRPDIAREFDYVGAEHNKTKHCQICTQSWLILETRKEQMLTVTNFQMKKSILSLIVTSHNQQCALFLRLW